MSEEPFVYLHSNGTPRRMLSVLPGHEGFVLHEGGRLHLLAGMHRLTGANVAAVFLVRVGAAHALDLKALGGAMLRDAGGCRHSMQVLGRLTYSVRRPDLLVDLLEREQIYDPRQLEREMRRTVITLLSSLFDGEPLRLEKLSENFALVSGEVQRRLCVALEPCGIGVQGLDLVAEPAPSAGLDLHAGRS